MPRHSRRPVSFRYTLYNKNGTYIDYVYGLNHNVVKGYLRQQGYKVSKFSSVKSHLNSNPDEYISKIMYRETSKHNSTAMSYLYVVRTLSTNKDDEDISFERKDLATL